MPKKKPIDKRLNKLFDELEHEEPNAKPAKTRQPKNAPSESTPSPTKAKSTIKRSPIESQKTVTQTDTALALAFKTSPNDWATLQIIDDTGTRKWNEDDQALVQQVTDQLAIALENARLFQESQRRAQEMSALAEVGREISATLELKTVLEKIAEYAIILLNSVTSAVYLPDPEFKTLIPFAVMGDEAEEIKNDPLEIGTGILGNIAKRKVGEIVNNAYEDKRAVTVKGTTGILDEHLMAVPVMLQDRMTGLMAIWRVGKGTEYSETEFDFFKNLAQQASIAIENARLFQNVNESQAQLSEALRIARIGYFEIDWGTQTVTMTDELFSLLNTSADKEGGYQLPLIQAMQKYVVAEDISIATKAVEEAVSAETDHTEVKSEARYKTTDGRTIWVSSTYKAERDVNGKPEKIIGSSQDITERKTNELTQAAITHISESALTAKTTGELFKTVHDSIQPILPAKNFYVALYDQNTKLISFPYHVDELDDEWEPRKLGRGLTAYVVRSGKPLRTTPEIYSDLEASGEVVSDGTPSVDWLGVPLRSGSTTIYGVMAVQTYDTSTRIDEKQAEYFSVIGTQTAAALERIQARESLQRQNTYLAASAEIGNLVTSTLSINTIFTRTVNLISDRLGFYFTGIYEIDEDRFHAVLREGTGGAGEAMKIQKHRVAVGSQTLIGQAAETGETVLANDVINEPLYQPNPLLLDTQSEIAIPLKVGGTILGVIDIQSKQAQIFSPNDISVFQALADQVAVAINNAILYEDSQELIKNLKEVDLLKSQFLANMSHELRTPLNSIIGFSRVILKGIDGPVSEMQNQDLTAIYNSGQHLLGLINDILDLARIEAGKMELNFEEVHLAEMVHSVFSTAKGLVKEKPIKLVEKIPDDMPAIRGDTMRVRQVLLNLISNASKFTDEGAITVESVLQNAPNGKLEALINVVDTGPGISPEGQEKLFKAFSQVDGSPTRKSGGSGLGLSICANLVQLHGGHIGVHSEEGKGSTFWFTLPIYNQPIEEIPEGKKVILAIDDDPQVISLYERYLNSQGYHVVPLTDPSKAKERIIELKPFATTLDIMMPNIDGWTVLTDIKSDPATRDTPIIICSIVEQTDKGFNLGATDYLVKPINQDDILSTLTRLDKDGNIHNVVIIDDDPDDLRLLKKILDEHGKYNVILAEGGHKGWESINNKKPDLIILDIFMPEMDGFTILEKLREESSLRDIPVLVVSGGGLTAEQQKQLSDYGQRLITKGSLKEEDLIASIDNALKRISN